MNTSDRIRYIEDNRIPYIEHDEEMREKVIHEFVEKIETKLDFERFMVWLLEDFAKNKQQWDDGDGVPKDLERYLDGFYGFVLSIDGYYYNRGETVDVSQLSWRILADILLAARVYE